MMKNLARRGFLRAVGCSMIAAPFARPLLAVTATAAKPQPAPPKVRLNVRDFGTTGDGTTKDTAAIQRTIDRCAVLGGGEVLLSAGKYLSGAIQLRSNVLLRLEADTVVLGSDNMDDYPVSEVRWEGKWIPGHVGLFYAIDAQRTGIVGPGKIVGANALGGRPTKESPLRHPALIEPIRCDGVRLEDFSTSYYRMWSIHPTECANVSISGLTIRSTGGNGDGIDVDSCRHVRIDRCDISTGDDCISLKSGRGEEGYTMHQPTEDVHISNCTFADSIFACIGIGSETSGGIRNVSIKNCKFTAAKSHAIYIKSRPGRGPFLENFVADGLEVSGVQASFLRLNMLNSGLQDQDPVPGMEGIPTAKNLRFSNIKVTDCPVLVDGTAVHPDRPIEGFTLSNVTGTCAQGISLANMRGVVLRNIAVTGFSGPLLRTHNVHGIGLLHAVAIEGPKLPEPVLPPAVPYIFR
ncbi:MAG TPA: glycosyl hydrolase family 28 protein [Acidobacteriaceae bacterium]